jgi:hydroxymethylbilane synthase
VLKRGDVRDAFISATGETLARLPQGAVVGSSSLRRQAQLRRLRPDLKVIEFRGNVETRLAKLERGVADATLLALAGLERLGLTGRVTSVMPTEEILPAVGQGAIGIACRTDDDLTKTLLERAYLAELDGSCRTPIAGLAELNGGTLVFRGLVLKPDGSDWHAIESAGPASDAARIGAEAGRQLLDRAGPDFLASFGPR